MNTQQNDETQIVSFNPFLANGNWPSDLTGAFLKGFLLEGTPSHIIMEGESYKAFYDIAKPWPTGVWTAIASFQTWQSGKDYQRICVVRIRN